VTGELSAPLLRELARGDRDRALVVWRKRFGQAPQTLEERARQQRFLAQRGFDAETIAAVLRAVRDGAADAD
jgi:regulatory protein